MAAVGLLDVAKRVACSGELHQQRNVPATGERVMGRIVDVTIVAIGNGAVAMTFVDVTDERAGESRLKEMAERDHLTGLWNRNRFRAEVSGTISRELPSVVAVLDLHGFKRLNETMGHSVADLLLQLLADRFTSQLPEHWTVSRLGGDEFAVLAPVADASEVAARLTSVVDTPFTIEGMHLTVEVSVGLASFPTDAKSEAELLRTAEAALQNAKGQGISHWVCTERDRQDAERRGQLHRSLRDAFTNEEFTLYAQPFVDVNSYEVVGAEALARWVLPGQGVLTPNFFLDLVATAGRSSELTDHMLAHALQLTQGGRLMSVNLSPADLHRPDLVPAIGAMLANQREGAGDLWLEILEERVFAAGRYTIDTLIAQGVRVAIDDFGAAFSSLTRLADHEISVLKLDRRLLDSLGTNQRARRVVRGVVDASHDLGAIVVAEGIETMEACSVVEDLGCDLIQGFLLGRPAPQAMVADLLNQPGRLTPDDWPGLDEIQDWERASTKTGD